MNKMRFEARGRFRVAPDRLWPLISDTQRLNRVLKLPVIRFKTEPLSTGGSRVIGEHPIGSALLSVLGQIFPLDPLWVSDESVLRRLPSFPLVRWIEHPFEWEAPRRYAVLREYFWSPLGLFPFLSFYGGAELTPTDDGGTEVLAFADVVPRNPQGALLTRAVLGPKNVHDVIHQCRIFEQYLLGQLDTPFPQLSPKRGSPEPPPTPPDADTATPEPSPAAASAEPPTPPGPDEPESTSAWRALVVAGVGPELADRLRRHLLEAPDEDVLKMRPFELADRWGTDRRETLVAFLHATTAGLVEMSWDVLCPNCRIAKSEAGSLADLRGQAHCEFCNITFDAAFDEQVEVRFSAAESIRRIEDRRFCSGGPMNTPHVLAQATLQPAESRPIALALSEGKYRVRSLQSKGTAVVQVEAAGTEKVPVLAGGETPLLHESAANTGGGAATAPASAVAFAIAPDAIRPPLAAADPDAEGIVEIRVQNDAPVEAVVAIEKPDWPDSAATAAVVGTIQEFRDLFGSEVLAPGLQLAIQRLAFLFTDLTGSTAMYQAVGQARAFRLVQDHFGLLGGAIAAHRGALIKTIGDAVMATFPTGADAVAAALEMQHTMRQLDTGGEVDTSRLLKIGIHEGPCIAVGANGRLDYFGTTINVAARVNHESRGGEVVLTADVYQDPAVQEQLRQTGRPLEQGEVQLRGVRAPVRLYRVGPS